MKGILKVAKGKVELYNMSAQRVKTYYAKGDAVRADWFEEDKESVLVHLSSGKVVIINRSCQVVKTI
jgi:hypothetical protein